MNTLRIQVTRIRELLKVKSILAKRLLFFFIVEQNGAALEFAFQIKMLLDTSETMG